MAGASGQDFLVTPQSVRQGETLRLHGGAGTVQARMNGVTVRIFSQDDSGPLGLMPVKIREVPGTYPVEFMDRGGTVIHTTTVTVRDAHYAKQNVVLSKEVAELKSSSDEAALVAAFHKAVSEKRYWAEPLRVPVPGCMTSLFGVQRYQNGVATGDAHGGLDQRGATGTPVHAVTGGVVRIVRMFNLRGGTVAIDHGQGLTSMYLHMSKLAAKEGDVVAAGDVVGYVGSTGRVTAPHLHWALYVYGTPVNPLQWVKVPPCAVPVKAAKKKSGHS
jgi:murein DD-endopeptidase MepM/ murein hydrolase activator NlpD